MTKSRKAGTEDRRQKKSIEKIKYSGNTIYFHNHEFMELKSPRSLSEGLTCWITNVCFLFHPPTQVTLQTSPLLLFHTPLALTV